MPQAETKAAKQLVLQSLHGMLDGNSTVASAGLLEQIMPQDLQFSGSLGVGTTTSLAEFQEHVLSPVLAALTDRSLDIDVVACEQRYCAVHGHLGGTMAIWVVSWPLGWYQG